MSELLHGASNPITASVQRVELGGRAAVCEVIGGTGPSVQTDWHAAPVPPAWNGWQREEGATDASPAGQDRRRGATLAWLVGLADTV